MGRSFWILDNISPLHQLVEAKKAKSYLYKPLDTYRYRFTGSGKSDLVNYPAPSMVIDYYLATKAVNDIKVEILSGQKVIRTFTSVLPPKDTTQYGEKNMATGFIKKDVKADIDKKAGAHRFRWDLLHEGPWDKNPAKNKKGGPMVGPGTYEVRLTVDGQTQSKIFKVLPDPRTVGKINGDDIKLQEKLALQIVVLEDSCKRVVDRIKEQHKKLSQLIKENKASESQKALVKQLTVLEEELIMKEGHYQKPVLIDQLNYLRQMLDQADQRPGKDAFDRYEELKIMAEKILISFQILKEKI